MILRLTFALAVTPSIVAVSLNMNLQKNRSLTSLTYCCTIFYSNPPLLHLSQLRIDGVLLRLDKKGVPWAIAHYPL